jgi:hypothetical protein
MYLDFVVLHAFSVFPNNIESRFLIEARRLMLSQENFSIFNVMLWSEKS